MGKKFSVIVADPPWPFKDSLKMSDVKRSAQANYDTMTMQQIREMPVKEACNPDGAVLCLWVPGSLLQEGLDTMKAWGFQHKQIYVWVKTKKQPFDNPVRTAFKVAKLATEVLTPKAIKPTVDKIIAELKLAEVLAFGMGRLFRQTHEICLVGISNNGIYKKLANKSQRSVCFAENLRHSAKPDDLQESLEIMFPRTRKLELFARRIRPGWTCLGNEIDGKDIYDALAAL
jgi:N6-adenosine-specific RNA methylase IME4